MKYAITACAGSGTAFAAALMTALGSPCGHEAVYQPVRWPVPQPALEGDSSWMAAPRRHDAVWLVRDPLAVLRSLLGTSFLLEHSTPYTAYAHAWLPAATPSHPGEDRAARLCRYIAGWYERYAPTEPDRAPVKVEDLSTVRAQREFFEMVAEWRGQAPLLPWPIRPRNSHGGAGRTEMTWTTVLDRGEAGQALAAHAARYGYPVG